MSSFNGKYIAHIRSTDKWEQTVVEHSNNVAKLAGTTGSVYGMEGLSSFCGRHHDDGKNTIEFFDYVKAASEGKIVVRGSVIHSTYGACFVNKYAKTNDIASKLAAEMIRTAIISHHGLRDALSKEGVISYQQAADHVVTSYCDVERVVYETNAKEDIAKEFAQASAEAKQIQSQINSFQPQKNGFGSAHFYLALYERLLTSILIDADRTDTACFEDNVKTPQQLSCQQRQKLWKQYRTFCDGKILKFQNEKEPSYLDKYRAQISEACAKYDGGASGIFRLVVPCGAGKTLSALRFALHTAEKYGKRHIFYIAPYNSILEQNADEIAKFIGSEEAVLRHHSNMAFDEENEEQEKRYRLLTENWFQSPVIATSAVHFLNSLFAAKTSAVRRMQALGESVIIVDEVQALPIRVIKLFNGAVNFLARFCNTTVLLCSATQPLFDKLEEYRVLEPREIIRNAGKYAEPFKRVEIEDITKGSGFSMDEAAQYIFREVQDAKSLLAIVNTKAAARIIAQRIQSLTCENKKYMVYHLSNNMCPLHRNAVISEMRNCLLNKRDEKRVICISTTLIEAGVDISFERVVRSLTGLDSIVQASGRCNRNREVERGKVSVIFLKEENVMPLDHIREAQEITREVLYRVSNSPERYPGGVLSNEAMDEYYSKYYYPLQKKEMAFPLKYDLEHTIIDLLTKNPTGSKHMGTPNNLLLKQAFREAGEAFEVIDNAGKEDLIVEYNDDAKKHIEALLTATMISEQKKELRYLQKYTVQVPSDIIRRLGEGVRTSERLCVRILAEKWYDMKYGVDEEPQVIMI